MKRTPEISDSQARGIVRRLHEFFYKDEDGNWDSELEVSGADFVEEAGLAFQAADMVPKGIEKLDEQYAQWRTSCPSCGGNLNVYQVTLARTGKKYWPNSPLEADGFLFEPDGGEDRDASTEDERVHCVGCGKCYDLSDLELDEG